MINIFRSADLEFTLPDGSVHRVRAATVGQYRQALALENSNMPWEDRIAAQASVLAGRALANALTPAECTQVVTALVCAYFEVDPAQFAATQELLKKKALAEFLNSQAAPSANGTSSPSASPPISTNSPAPSTPSLSPKPEDWLSSLPNDGASDSASTPPSTGSP